MYQGGSRLKTATSLVKIYYALVDEPTVHELQSKSEAAAWESIRQGILSAVTESSTLSIGQMCHLCPNPAIFRCRPLVFYCFECYCKDQESRNLFHIAEKWEVHNLAYSVDCRLIDSPMHPFRVTTMFRVPLRTDSWM